MITITDNHVERLARLNPALVTPALSASLEGSAEIIAHFAAESIRDGGISGAGHIVSAPGETPNADTHDLDRSIHAGELIDTGDQIQTSVIADSDHALYLELGTSRMAERPFLRPAVAQNRPDMIRRLSEAFRETVGI